MKEDIIECFRVVKKDMNIIMDNRLKIINKILDGKSKQRLRESFFKNNYNEIWDEVMNFVPFDITFKEKLWYWVNDITKEVKCKTCKVNNTTFNKNWLEGYREYCSAKCSANSKKTKDIREKTNLEKYGVNNVAKLELSKEKQEKTNLEKYGTKSSFQNEDVKKKWRENVKEKWGEDHIFKVKEIKDKIKKTINKKWNVDYFTQSEYYKSLYKDEKFLKFFKEQIYNSLDKRIQTTIDNWGVEYYLQSDEFNKNRDKYIEDLKELYFKSSKEKYSYSFYELINKKGGLLEFLDIRNGDKFKIWRDTYYNRRELEQELNINILPLYNSIAPNVNESELYDFLNSLNIEYIKNDRTILDGKELDIYIPSYNLAIEHNGLYWHSELKIKDKKYHLNKSLDCNKNGIQLLHIWEDDWILKKDICKNIIRNKLNKIDNIIYARRCIIKEVKSNIARKFLDENHIQGFSMSKYKIGLYYEGKLVSLMTFGYRRTNSKKEFELIRFCNKLNTNVVGASSKLFKYFIKNYKIEENYIISYADISLFDGKMYDMFNFVEEHLSKPNYYWVVNRKKEHRWKFNKQKLIKEGFDGSKTEVQIMHERGYYRIWSCGQKRYVYKM